MVKALTAFFLSRITAEGGGTYTVV
jgi:hypothetical protein